MTGPSAWARERVAAARSLDGEPAELEELRSPGVSGAGLMLGIFLGAILGGRVLRPRRGTR